MAKAKKKKAAKKKAPVKKKAKDDVEDVAPEVEPEVLAPPVPALDPRVQARTHRARMGQSGPIKDRPKGAPKPSEVRKEYETAKWYIFKLKNGSKIKIPKA